MPLSPSANNAAFADDGDPFPLAIASSGSTTSASSAKPVATIPQLADYLVNGFWQYNSTIAHHWSSNTVSFNINGLNASEQLLALSALQAWHEVANINFIQTSAGANITFNHSGTMTAFTSANWTGSGAITSATVDISADWVTNDGGAYDGKTGIDSYAYQTYIHEIGHALGLGHQGPYNGSAIYSSNATYADDTWQYSIMSYFPENNYSGSSYRYVVTPQMADIYAVDSIYGAATSTRTGDTVYGFHNNAGSVFNFGAYSQAPALTIYDSGGNDTLDCSGYSVAQTIDLHPGTFSSVGGLVHNIGIALNATIENAIGGSGNDTLIANGSVCTLTGGAGADAFVFDASSQLETITDFVSGVDHIDISAIDAIGSTAVHNSFRFIGSSGFDHSAGELNYSYNATLGITVLQGDTNGDGVADFTIDLTGHLTLTIGDFSAGVVLSSIPGPITSAADFNGDGRSDILWRNDDGGLAIWTMTGANGAQINSGNSITTTPDSSWHIQANADFNGDSSGDVLWQNDNGMLAVWTMGGGAAGDQIQTGGAIGSVLDSHTHVQGTGDFNADGKSDILLRNDSGIITVWTMGGTAGTTIQTQNTIAASPDAHWKIQGLGDFNGDGHSDILWRNDTSGTLAVWTMGGTDGTQILSGDQIGSVPDKSWHVRGVADFNGDGHSDILWRNDNGTLAVWTMGGTSGNQIETGNQIGSSPDSSWKVADTGDYNGDGTADILWRNNNGTLAVWTMSGTDGTHILTGNQIGSVPSTSWHVQAHQFDII